MSRRALSLLTAVLLLAAPNAARADFTFTVTQDVTSLGLTSASPYFMNWVLANFNDGVNKATISNFQFTNITPGAQLSTYIRDQSLLYNGGNPVNMNNPGPATPLNIFNPNFSYYTNYDGSDTNQGISDTVFGSVTTAGIGPIPSVVPTVSIFEDPNATAGSSPWAATEAWQLFTITNPGQFASIQFEVTLTNNFNSLQQPDNFQFNIGYTDPADIGDPYYQDWQLATQILATLPNGGNALAYVDITDTSIYSSVQVGVIDPQPGSGSVQETLFNNGLRAAATTPEPGTMVVWGVMLSGLGGYFYRRRRINAVPAVA